MTDFIDTYLKSSDREALAAFCAGFVNVIGLAQGRAATPEMTDPDGNVFPAMPAVGDPAKWYACVRYTSAVTPTGGVEVCDAAEGASVVGVWA